MLLPLLPTANVAACCVPALLPALLFVAIFPLNGCLASKSSHVARRRCLFLGFRDVEFYYICLPGSSGKGFASRSHDDPYAAEREKV